MEDCMARKDANIMIYYSSLGGSNLVDRGLKEVMGLRAVDCK